MIRPTWMWIAVSLVAMAGGCRMCASCYDYAGPVFGPECPGGCGCDARAGSILSAGMPMVPENLEPATEEPSGSTEPQTMPTAPEENAPTTEPQLPPYVPPTTQSSSGRLHPEFGVDPKMIISITDRKVGEESETSPQETAEEVAPSTQSPLSGNPAQPVSQGVQTSPSGQ